MCVLQYYRWPPWALYLSLAYPWCVSLAPLPPPHSVAQTLWSPGTLLETLSGFTLTPLHQSQHFNKVPRGRGWTTMRTSYCEDLRRPLCSMLGLTPTSLLFSACVWFSCPLSQVLLGAPPPHLLVLPVPTCAKTHTVCSN